MSGGGRAPSPSHITAVHLPSEASGAVLAAFIRSTRLAIVHGDVLVDAAPCRPLDRLVLLRLEQSCRRAGRSWLAPVRPDGAGSSDGAHRR